MSVGAESGERVRGDRRLVLDDAAEHPVGAVDPEEVLELVERDEAPEPRSLVHLRREIEQAKEDALDVDPRVRLQRRRKASCPEGEADLPRAKEGVDGAAHGPLERAVVRALDPDDDAREREHALEVDERRRVSGLRGLAERAAKEARLAVPTGRHEARGVPTGGERDEPGRLLVAVDHLLGEKLAGDPKRIDVLGHAPSLHDAFSSVYMK